VGEGGVRGTNKRSVWIPPKESIVDQTYSLENLLYPLFAKEGNSSLCKGREGGI